MKTGVSPYLKHRFGSFMEGERALVPAAAVEEARIGAQAEGLGLEVVEIFVHVKKTS